MTFRVDVRSNIERVVADFRAETENVATATYRALNRALDSSATNTSREIRKVYNVRDRAVKNALAKVRANKNRLWATLRIEGARIPLIEFDARWRPGQPVGATVKVLVASGRKVVAGGFIAATKGGQSQVWRRKGRARYPIVTLRSVSVPQAFSNKAVVDAVQALAIEAFEKNFEQQLQFLGGANGG